MKHTCGAWYTRCEMCGRKNICPSCEAIRADAWSPTCVGCEQGAIKAAHPKVTKEVPVTEFEEPETFQEMRGDTGAIAWRLCHDMVKHIGGELGLNVKVTRGRGWSTWGSNSKHQPKRGDRINLGIKCIHEEYKTGQPLMYETERSLWRQYEWGDGRKAMWFIAVHEMAHVYGAHEYNARQHNNGWRKALRDLQTLFPYDEVMEAVQ